MDNTKRIDNQYHSIAHNHIGDTIYMNNNHIDKLLLLTDAQIVNIYNAICSDNPYIYESYHDGILDFIPTCDEIRYVYDKRILLKDKE